ncbi:MAG: SIS domain-containing protein [Breznakia sp.]
MEKLQEDLKAYIKSSREEVNHYFDGLDLAGLQMAKELILEVEKTGNRVHVSGIGKPGHVSGYVASLLSSTGTPAYQLDASEAIHGSAGQVKCGDVVIAISNSGETKELKAAVETLQKNEAKLIAVSGNKKSWLAKVCDIHLFAGVNKEGDILNKPPRASILAEMVVLQCLSVLLQYERNITPQMYVKWHPGGALGKSIREDENGN